MTSYDSFMDTRIQWIGLVPSHWARHRIKYDLLSSSAGVWGNEERGDSNDIPCFRIADYNYEKGIVKNNEPTIRNIDKKQQEGRILHFGDLLIEKSGGGDVAPVGRVVRFQYTIKAVCSNFIHSITVNEKKIDKNFLYYLSI